MKSNNRARKNILIVALLVFVIPISITLAMLFYVQILNKNEYQKKAVAQWTKDLPVPSKRGDIYDRNGKKLAISSAAYMFYARPSLVEDKEGLALLLSKRLNLNYETTLEKLLSKKDEVLIKKKIDVDTVMDIIADIDAGKLIGLNYYDDTKRYYTQNNFASYVLGFTNTDNQGHEGVELKFEKYLNGLPGRDIKLTDPKGTQLPGSQGRYVNAVDGNSLVLTLDETIEHYIEKAASETLKKNKAKRVTVIVMDPKTGDILGMTSKPDYDSNNPRSIPKDFTPKEWKDLTSKEQVEQLYKRWRNPSVADTYEPGSTFKVITACAVLEENVVKLDDKFFCKGYINLYGTKIKCWRYPNPHGVETFVQAIANSCNPAVVQMAQRLGKTRLYDYIKAFGFGSYTGIQLPGESPGSVRTPKEQGPIEFANISFGQGILVTPLQLITAISAVGNNGYLMEPRIAKKLLDANGKVIEEFKTKTIRQVVSKETTKKMLDVLEFNTVEGTGSKGYIPGYRIASKTGTAQKVVNGAYKDGVYVASYVALAPANDPKVAILTIIDEPNKSNYFGGVIAGEAAHGILQDVLRYLNIAPQYTEKELKDLKSKKP